MKAIAKILFASILSTLAFLLLLLLIVIGLLSIPELGVHITYPFRLLRGTEIYEGETRGQEVLKIWERIIVPFIFIFSVAFFYWRSRKMR
jgi:hypothetical protein